MHVLLTNDDGPPDAEVSPYVQYLVDNINNGTKWDLSIVVPHVQRSWIGKAHLIGKNITGKYLYTGPGQTSEQFDSPQETSAQEWVLLDGTPASCANIGVNHLYESKGPVDLVISGPNFGRNTSAPYILSSGTVGGALEAAMCGKRAIALSYSYTQPSHPPTHLVAASELAVRIINHLLDNWDPSTQIYSINIPLHDDLSPQTPVRVVPVLEHSWGAIFAHDDKSKLDFRWSPDFAQCDRSVRRYGRGNDAQTVMDGEISITPLRATFMHGAHAQGPLLDLSAAF